MTPEMVTALGGVLVAVLATVGGAVKWVDWRIRQRETDREKRRAADQKKRQQVEDENTRRIVQIALNSAATREQVQNSHQTNLRDDLDHHSGQMAGLAGQIAELMGKVDRLADVPAALDRLEAKVDRDRKAIRSEVDTVRNDLDRIKGDADHEHGRLWKSVDQIKHWFTAGDDSE